jgi:hypothetical protein
VGDQTLLVCIVGKKKNSEYPGNEVFLEGYDWPCCTGISCSFVEPIHARFATISCLRWSSSSTTKLSSKSITDECSFPANSSTRMQKAHD